VRWAGDLPSLSGFLAILFVLAVASGISWAWHRLLGRGPSTDAIAIVILLSPWILIPLFLIFAR
jgi:hypothetical protein